MAGLPCYAAWPSCNRRRGSWGMMCARLYLEKGGARATQQNKDLMCTWGQTQQAAMLDGSVARAEARMATLVLE